MFTLESGRFFGGLRHHSRRSRQNQSLLSLHSRYKRNSGNLVGRFLGAAKMSRKTNLMRNVESAETAQMRVSFVDMLTFRHNP